MLVLLDECIPRRLRTHLGNHVVRTVQELGLVGLKNGALLRRASMLGIEAFITVDHSVEFQINLRTLSLGIVVLHAHSNDIEVLRHLTPQLQSALEGLQPGRLIHIR